MALGASWPGAVAVSGGGDSVALLLLLVEWARRTGLPDPVVLTVNHGLMRGSSGLADSVAARAKLLGIPAHVFAWRGRKPQSDIENAAREARYRLMGEWCRRNGLYCLYVAHTLEDQAETFLLRLARGSGVDGLAAMAQVSPLPVPQCDSPCIARPLLAVSRVRLRAFLAERCESRFEDPMNEDPRFARTRVRAVWPALESFGLTAERIAGAACHLARARTALELDARCLIEEISSHDGAAVLVNASQLRAAPDEIALRVLARLLMNVSAQTYRPRFDRLERLLTAIRADRLGGGRTLHGCCIKPARGRGHCPDMLRIAPEPKRGRRQGSKLANVNRDLGR